MSVFNFFGISPSIEVLGGVFAGGLILVLFAILFGYGNAQYRAGYLKGDAKTLNGAQPLNDQARETGVAGGSYLPRQGSTRTKCFWNLQATR